MANFSHFFIINIDKNIYLCLYNMTFYCHESNNPRGGIIFMKAKKVVALSILIIMAFGVVVATFIFMFAHTKESRKTSISYTFKLPGGQETTVYCDKNKKTVTEKYPVIDGPFKAGLYQFWGKERGKGFDCQTNSLGFYLDWDVAKTFGKGEYEKIHERSGVYRGNNGIWVPFPKREVAPNDQRPNAENH